MKKILLIFAVIYSTNVLSQVYLSEKIENKIDSLFEEKYKKNEPGGIVAVIKKNQNIYRNFKGLSSIEFDIPISEFTMFDIGSLSKQFTAFVTLLLEQKGKLELNDSISVYLPELKSLPHQISIKQLLNHTHGLPNSHELSELCGKERMNHEQLVNMLLKINSINFQPREKYEYNNTGYILLAGIISRIENKKFGEVLNDEIFSPLEMKNTIVIESPFQLIKNKAVSYSRVNNEYFYLFNDKTSMGPGGICSNINDLLLWTMNFITPKVGTPEMISEMNKNTILNSGEVIDYGLGIQSKIYKGKAISFHGGADASYGSYLMHIPQDSLSIIALSNDGSFLH